MATLTEEQTIQRLKLGYSIARYGDGEFAFITKSKGVHLMQDFSIELQRKLLKVLTTPLDKLLVGIPRLDKNPRPWVLKVLERVSHLIFTDTLYASSFISRPSVVNQSNKKYFSNIKSVWSDKDIVLVNFNSNIVNHYLYKDCSSIQYIAIPKRNCFEQYQTILDECRKYYKQGKMFLLSAGPTATCLAYDITLEGKQCLDIGHITYEYAQFIKEDKPRLWVSQN